jgi:phosphoglycolate phosphatase
MQACFFDLDGTLTDSRPGLHLSFRAALDAIGAKSLGDAELDGFLGTPLPEMFQVVKPKISDREIELGIAAFREAYEGGGIRLNRLYPGVRDMLQMLKRNQVAVWIVTSKPEFYAKQVVEDLGLRPLVTGIVGAGLAELDTKSELVGRALTQAGVAKTEALMIGDRFYDVEGALHNGVTPIGALWGYGTEDELRAAGCRKFAKSVPELCSKFLDQVAGSLDVPTAALG